MKTIEKLAVKPELIHFTSVTYILGHVHDFFSWTKKHVPQHIQDLSVLTSLGTFLNTARGNCSQGLQDLKD